jgi:hypothetical protein
MIRAVTSGDYRHAALHVGHGIAVEANDPGVVPVFLPAVSYEANTRVYVRRLRGLPPGEQSQLVDFVWEVLYRPYSTRGAIGSVWQKLRQQSDPGYFCSQLAAAAYEKIKSPIADCEAARCKPSDLDASPHLIDVPEAIHKVGKDVHTATTTLMIGAYEKFVDAGAFGEKFLIDVCAKNLPKVFAPPFNLYDLIRQFFDGTVDIEAVGKPCDAFVAKAIRDLIKARPLTPCPGISVATYLAVEGISCTTNLIDRVGASAQHTRPHNEQGQDALPKHFAAGDVIRVQHLCAPAFFVRRRRHRLSRGMAERRNLREN